MLTSEQAFERISGLRPAGRPEEAQTAAATRLATSTSGSETTEPSEVASVSVFRLPLVERSSRVLNIQKKLLLTCRANIAPDAMASAMTTGSTPSEPTIGAMIPAAVIAPTETEPIAKCSTAAISQASRMLMIDRRVLVDGEQVLERLVHAGLGDDGAERAADAGDEQDLAGGVEAGGEDRADPVRTE